MITYETTRADSETYAHFTKDGYTLQVPITNINEADIQSLLESELECSKDQDAERHMTLEENMNLDQNIPENTWWAKPEDVTDL